MRKFGIEVEFAGSVDAVMRELRIAGLSNRSSMVSYLAHGDTDWVVKHDASVTSGGELVGPPLDWDNPEDRAQVQQAFAALHAAGARTSESAGVHVHIDANDLSAKQIAGVARTFTKFEDQIYRIATSGWLTMRRGGHTYCKPMTDEMIQKVAVAKTREQLARAWYGTTRVPSDHSHGSRYHGLNLHSWFFRGTVEFRVFNSTMNPKRVEAYITLCMAIVQDARDGRLRSVNRRFAVGDMVRAGAPGSEERKKAEKKQIHHLSQMLRWENKTSPISKEDLALVTWAWNNSVPQDIPRPAYSY